MVKAWAERPELMPRQALPYDAGFDLCAAQGVRVPFAGRVVSVPTGVRLAMPRNVFGLVRLRSGFARQGYFLASSGIIDPDYRGELSVPITHMEGNQPGVMPGQRFAQIVFLPILGVWMQPVAHPDGLGVTPRGEGGFGSTGS